MNDLVDNATLLMMTEASHWWESIQDEESLLKTAAQINASNCEGDVPLFI